MKGIKLNKKGKRFYNSVQKALSLYQEATRLRVLYGMILTTPAKEIKKMKLRQIKKELEMLSANELVKKSMDSSINKEIIQRMASSIAGSLILGTQGEIGIYNKIEKILIEEGVEII